MEKNERVIKFGTTTLVVSGNTSGAEDVAKQFITAEVASGIADPGPLGLGRLLGRTPGVVEITPQPTMSTDIGTAPAPTTEPTVPGDIQQGK